MLSVECMKAFVKTMKKSSSKQLEKILAVKQTRDQRRQCFMEQNKQNKKKENILLLDEAGKQSTRVLQQVLKKDDSEKQYFI